MATLVENGFLGCVVFSLYVGSFALESWKRRREGVLGLGVLATCVLATTFLTREFQGKGPFLLAAGASLLIHSRQYLKQSHQPGRVPTGVSPLRSSISI
jgi:hypothetical protein